MLINLAEEGKAAVLRYFPERQIYLRSGGEVSYFVLKTRTQLIATIFAGLVALWCLITMLNVIWGHNPLSGKSKENRLVEAKYERLLEEAEDRLQSAELLLAQQEESFSKVTKSIEAKHAAIAVFHNQPNLGTDLAEGIMDDFAKPKIFMSPTVREPLSRQSRIQNLAATEVDLGLDIDRPLENIDQTQNTILLTAENETLDQIETSRSIIEATDLNIQDVLGAGSFGSGGPLMSVATEGGDERVNAIKARVLEAKILEDALKSVPLGHPVDGDTYRTSTFGVRKDPFTKRPAMHEAVDFAGPVGTPIVSTADGTVIYSGNKAGYGKVVIVSHGHGFTTKYAHLSKTYVKRGQKVLKGERVGGMGSTGRSTGSHLHYEVHFQDRVYDPEKFLKAGLYVQ